MEDLANSLELMQEQLSVTLSKPPPLPKIVEEYKCQTCAQTFLATDEACDVYGSLCGNCVICFSQLNDDDYSPKLGNKYVLFHLS
jgi:hypothetical protein